MTTRQRQSAAERVRAPRAWLGCVLLAACASRAGAASAFGRQPHARGPRLAALRGGSEPPADGAGADDELPPDDDVEIEDFDIVVIGGGSGGLACAQEAAKHGKSVAVCDFVAPSPAGSSWGLGGTCVNVGCIPKKLMHHAALLGGALAEAHSYGWQAPAHPSAHSWGALVRGISEHIGSLSFGYRSALLSAGVDYLNAHASFEHAHLVRAVGADGSVRRLRAKAFVLAVGGRPRYLDDIEGGRELVVSSDDLFSLQEPPGKTLCVGGGYVALECAGLLAGLGMEAHVLVRSVPLRGFDVQMAELLCAHMQAQCGVRFIRAAVPLRIQRLPADGGARARLRVTWRVLGNATSAPREESDEYDTVLVAVGRDAQTASLRLERAGVELDPASGKVLATGEQTTAAHIHAVGDVLHGKPELTPVAVKAGQLLARRLCGMGSAQMDYAGVPTAVFAPLEYAAVGLSEEEAIEQLGEAGVEVLHTYFKPLEWALPHGPDNACYAKVLFEAAGGRRALGVHVCGPNAGEMVQGFALALKAGATREHFEQTVAIHPTCAEELVTLSVTKRSGLDPRKKGC